MPLSASFLKNVTEADEKIICRSRLHGIYLVSGVLWFSVLAGIGWGSDYLLWHYLGAFVPDYQFNSSFFNFGLREGWIGWMFSAGGMLLFLTEYIKFTSTDLVVTSKRIVYKTGWLNIKLDQTDLSDVRGVHVDQGMLGRFLNYGRMHLDSRFVGDVFIPYIKNPYGLLRHIQKIKSDLEESSRERFMETSHPHGGMSQTIIQIMPSDTPVRIKQVQEEKPVELLEISSDKVRDDFNHK